MPSILDLPVGRQVRPFFFLLILGTIGFGASLATDSRAQTAPDAPLITEPEFDGQVVNPQDVHMECAPFSDLDPGDTHACSDWQIILDAKAMVVWEALCVTDEQAVHTHLGDGDFLNDYLGQLELDFSETYTLRNRHQDSTGLWSDWAERSFVTGPPSTIYPLELTDILPSPAPRLLDGGGTEIILPVSAPAHQVIVDTGAGDLLARLYSGDGLTNLLEDTPEQPGHVAIRVRIVAGGGSLALVPSELVVHDVQGDEHRIYLPGLSLGPGESRIYWVSENGSSFHGESSPTAPDFSDLARSAAVPWQLADSAFRVDVVASDLQMPVNIAFVPVPGENPGDPLFYVNELYGIIKVVTRDYTVSDYATGLLNYNPTGNFPGSGEQGLSGLVVDPVTGDIFAALLYDAAPPDGPHYPKVIRLNSLDGGMTAANITTILDMPGESQGQSHFISNVTLGPDDKLYVHMGDGFDAGTALDLDSFRGKILRMEKNGDACVDNPFYDEGDGIAATDYVYAYGLRNPFGGAWRVADSAHYEVENGPGQNDRFAKVLPGDNFGWDGTSESMTVGAIYNWSPPHAPVNITFLDPSIFGGSGFPVDKMDRAFVTESGPTWATGPQNRGKRIVEFQLDPSGQVVSGPTTLIEYNGAGKATAVALAAGPDGLYFSDFYKDTDYVSPIDRGAHILRVSFVGRADFVADRQVGPAPLNIQFTDQSNVPGASAWLWSFGDGATSTDQHPAHTYAADGIYDVTLEVTGDNGLAVHNKGAYILVGNSTHGLRAEYFDDKNLGQPVLSRIDPTIDFEWGNGSPDPSIDNNTFSVRWTGEIEALYSETHTFTARVDDGVRLWVDGQLIIDQWINQSPTEHTGEIELVAGGRYGLTMEYYEDGGGATAQLFWESLSLVKEIVPTSQFWPVAGVADTPLPQEHRFSLDGNHPNPFNPRTRIAFSLARDSFVELVIFDLRGRRVAGLLSGSIQRQGPGSVVWDGLDGAGRSASSGVYLYRLRAEPTDGSAPFEARDRMLLLR